MYIRATLYENSDVFLKSLLLNGLDLGQENPKGMSAIFFLISKAFVEGDLDEFLDLLLKNASPSFDNYIISEDHVLTSIFSGSFFNNCSDCFYRIFSMRRMEEIKKQKLLYVIVEILDYVKVNDEKGVKYLELMKQGNPGLLKDLLALLKEDRLFLYKFCSFDSYTEDSKDVISPLGLCEDL